MIIKSNIEAMRSYLNLQGIDSAFNKSLNKISSGMELPTPEYGGGNFAIANDMEALYKGYVTGAKNVQDAVGFLEVTQTVLMQVNDQILQMQDLASRAATETMTTAQRRELNWDYKNLTSNINTILTNAKYNGISLFSINTRVRTLSIVYGENQSFKVSTFNVSAVAATGIGYSTGSISNQASAVAAIGRLSTSNNYMNRLFAQLGSRITHLQAKVDILNEQGLQEKTLESRINELDFAKEMKTFTSLQVVLQASNAMVAQANMKAQMVLQLFK